MHEFDTEDFPARDRLALLHDVFVREFMRVELDEVDETIPFRQRMRLCALPGLTIPRAQSTPLHFRRGKAMLRDHREEMLIVLVHGGEARLRHDGHDVIAGPGEAFIWGMHRPSEGVSSAGYECTTISIPRDVLLPRVGDPERALGRHIPRSSSTLRLLDHYLCSLFQMGPAELAPPAQELAAQHVVDMVTMLCRTAGTTVDWRQDREEGRNSAGTDRAATSPRTSLRAARLRAIQDDVRASIGGSPLSVGQIAARHGISVNYLGLLFREEGTTFTDFVRGERLDRAWQRLVDPRHLHVSIATIAYDAGFNDISYFNRSFRQRFGRSPREVRAMAYENRGDSGMESNSFGYGPRR